MSLCETCRKGRNEICRYFLAEFLENDTGCVTRCPEFEEEDDEPSEDLWNVDGVYAEGEGKAETEEAEKAGGEGDNPPVRCADSPLYTRGPG